MVALSGTGQRFLARTPLAAMLVDGAGRTIAVNDRLHELLGYEAGELVGVNALDYVHPDDREAVNAALIDALERSGPKAVQVIARVHHRCGSAIEVLASGVNLLEEPGFGGILVTISQTDPDPAAVPRRRGWFEAVVSGTDDIVQVFDEDGRFLWASGPVERLVGIPAEAMVGLTVFQVGNPQHPERTRVWFDAIRATPGNHPPIVGERRLVDGSSVHLEVRVNNLLDDPEVGGIVVTSRDISEQVAAERARLFAADVIERAPVSIVTTDAAGSITSWNPGAERVMGWTSREAVGQRLRDLNLYNADTLGAMVVAIDELRAGGTVELEADARARDGELVPTYLVVTGMLDNEGDYVGTLMFGLDLREQTDARRALDRAEARWLSLSKHAHELVLLIDESAIVQWAGTGFTTLLGLDPEQLVGTPIRDLVHPEDQRRPGGLADLLARTGGRFRREYRLRHADGTWRVFDVDVTDLRHDPAVGAFLATGQDVTDRIAAEAANRRMATAIESAGAAVVITDIDRRIVSWNREAERLSGQRAQDVLGHELNGGAPPGDDAVRADVISRLAAGATVTYETERMSADKRRLPLSVTASPVLDGVGELIGYSYIIFDITERRAAERERDARARQSRALAELGQRALSGAPVDDVLEDACELASEAIGIPHVHAVLLSSDGRFHELAAAVGALAGQVGRRDPVAQRGWTTAIGRRRHPVVVPDFEADGAIERPAAFSGTSVRSGVLCAVDGRDGPIGFLSALADTPRAFAEPDVAFLQSIANVLAATIDRSRVSAEMQRRALHDELTGLPNRALLLDRLAQAVTRLERATATLGLLFVDLDRFKRVNDTLGHRAGDKVLVETAQRLLEAVRLGDTVARTGGDEFLVLTEEIGDPAGAVVLAQRVAQAIAEPVIVDGHGIHITASIGIAVADARTDPEELVRNADLAMYRAKKEGRDRIQVFDASMHDEAMTRMTMEESLRSAVSRGAVHVVFQPQASLLDGRLLGIEALARWEHPRLGQVPPSAFVGLAEEIGVLDEITRAVLHAACAALAAARALVPQLTAAVNLTPRQLGRRHVIDLVDESLAAFGLPHHALVIELTESAALDDTAALKILGELRDRGVRVSIDDFGTGYSSMSRLTRLAVDEVKLDRSFVSGVADDQGCAAVVSATATLAHVMRLRLVAEGVESERQRNKLLELGCTEGQGWLISGPLQHDELLAWIQQR